MPEASPDVADHDVLRTLRTHWDVDVDAVERLPLGGRSLHWRADERGAPQLFVTARALGGTDQEVVGGLEALEAAQAGAGHLAFAVDGVVAGLPRATGGYVAGLRGPASGFGVTAAPWVWGEPVEDPPRDRTEVEALTRLLMRLHRAAPPPSVRHWRPRTRTQLPDEAWTERYLDLAERARARPLVPTHGAPHAAHRMRAPTGRLLLTGWSGLLLAPVERDLRHLVRAGAEHLVDVDAGLLELFDLEAHLDPE
ncbi:hypothetical protein [Nocardioides acrostichi]|uniref:Aminoglycoside phosphotransferase domain-containing protein n=1 Tax=Nocardioides acrostichi TaxID=2784339 RepID=A0A930YA01_9ACTN|nr:hypothetical protein [Nocardioides acrostichi]MBF4160913.1 hypothetical protein [Nocardioides acrostichi]